MHRATCTFFIRQFGVDFRHVEIIPTQYSLCFQDLQIIIPLSYIDVAHTHTWMLSEKTNNKSIFILKSP